MQLSHRSGIMAENLILFTITPVQKFITTARKTEDLWLGSYLLSHLNATAMHQIYAKDGIHIIYPSIGAVSPFESWKAADITLPSFPNLFLALSKQHSLEDLSQTMQYVQEVVHCEFEKIARHGIDIFVRTITRGNERWRHTNADRLFKEQVNHFFQLYWVVSSGSRETYQEWYAQTGTRLASVKNCRAFDQITASGRKCSLCGEMEIFHDGTADPMKWWLLFARRRAKFCREGEALCAVCLAKRLAGQYFGKQHPEIEDLSFPSTSEVAVADFKLHIANDQTHKDFVEAVNALRNTNGNQLEVTVNPVPKLQEIQKNWNVDGDWLYEDSFSAQTLKRDHGINEAAQIAQQEAIRQCDTLRKDLIKSIGFDPSRYFAVIVLDGDDMGQMISQIEDSEAHTEISRTLNAYTTKVRQIVDGNYLGKLIFAGGDDVLALANLADLLDILSQLRSEFPPNLNSDGNQASTASAGVCIAHHKVPLGDVLERARIVEQAAKSVDGKNALGIALLKHSGNISQTVFKWEYQDAESNSIDMMKVSQNLVRLIQTGEVSKKFIYAFRDVFTRLTTLDGDLEIPGIVDSELQRLIRRATSDKVRSDPVIEARISENVSVLTALLAEKRMKFEDFVSFLEIVNFIARGGQRDETLSETQ